MGKERLNILDIIRGVMIIFVIITHFRFIYPDDYLRFGFVFWIDMAVPVFMIITGYVTATSYKNKEIETIEQAYSIEIIVPKLLRFLIPFSIVMLVELLYLIIVSKSDFIEIIRIIIRGGVGPGAYYTPIMLQVIFLLPVLYVLIKKYDLFGAVFCFLVNAIWEMVQDCWGMDVQSYKLIALRYISVLAFGVFIAIGKKKLSKRALVLLFLVGILWQTVLNYVPLHPIFMNYEWARVNYFSSLFVVAVMYVLISRYSASKVKILILQEIGKASFNIFLVQMIFYGCGLAGLVYKIINVAWIQLAICISSCISLGYFFFKIENNFTNCIIKSLRQKNFYKSKIIEGINLCNRIEK